MNTARRYWIGGVGILAIIFLVPFAFIVLTALKDRKASSLREFSLPSNGIHLWDNSISC